MIIKGFESLGCFASFGPKKNENTQNFISHTHSLSLSLSHTHTHTHTHTAGPCALLLVRMGGVKCFIPNVQPLWTIYRHEDMSAFSLSFMCLSFSL